MALLCETSSNCIKRVAKCNLGEEGTYTYICVKKISGLGAKKTTRMPEAVYSLKIQSAFENYTFETLILFITTSSQYRYTLFK